MYVDINTYKNKFNYIVTISDTYNGYNSKEDVIEQLILDLEKLKARLIEEEYKKRQDSVKIIKKVLTN